METFLASIPEWVRYAGVAVAAATSAAAWVRWVFPHLRLTYLTWLTARGMAHDLGPNAAAIIRQLAADVERDRSLTVLRHDAICNRLGLGVFVADATEGAWTFSNDVMGEMLGLSCDALAGFGWLGATVGDRTAILAEWKFAVKNGMGFERELRMKNARTNETDSFKVQARPAMAAGVRLSYVGIVERAGDYVCPWRGPEAEPPHNRGPAAV